MDWKERFLYPAVGPILKAGVWLVSRRRLPTIDGILHLQGLQNPVEILRDRWGIPHIYAQNSNDTIFAQGYVHAQDRFWQMDFTRRVVKGRLAEILGELALPADRVMRTLGLYHVAEQEAQLEPGYICNLMNAYCNGVNAWLENAIQHKKLPVECTLLGYTPEPWQIADIFCWEKLMAWVLAANWSSELYRRLLLEKLGSEKVAELEIDIDREWSVVLDLGLAMGGSKVAEVLRPYVNPGLEEGVGSNNWVLHGSRTSTGKPLLANDMHLELSTPSIWYQNHIVGGELDVTGISLPGVPMVISGHNRRVAWGYTDSFADAQDLYEEHLRHGQDGRWEYEYQDRWYPAEIRKELIQVKKQKPVEEEVVVTRHGPIVNVLFKDTFPDVPPMALRWTTFEPDNSFQTIYQMNIAQTCQEFHEALRLFDDPSQNVVYADVDGNIGYTMNGRVPIRTQGDGTVPVPGWTGEYEWQGYIPLEELPHLSNPPRGYVATANNQIQRPDFPHYISRDFVVSERIGRIVELIESREKIDIAYIQSMQYDRVAISSRLMARVLGSLEVTDPDLQEIVNKMRSWDGTLDKDSPMASIFEAVVRQAGGMIIDHHMGELGKRASGEGPFAGTWPDHLWDFFFRLLDQPDSPWFDLGHGEQRDDVLRLALRMTVDFLKKELGPELSHWKWGRLHKAAFNHILGNKKPLDRVFSIGPFPIGGDGNTIAASLANLCNLNYCPIWGPPFRFIADLNDLDHCWGVLAPGQSGNLASPHFADGVKPWFEGTYHPLLFRRDEIEAALEGRLELRPAQSL